MPQSHLLIFDLDGTLIDSKRDLADSVNATLIWMNREPLPIEVVSSYVGNGAPVLIQRALPGLSEEEHADALQYFLDYYREHMLDYTVLYPGVREALDRLHMADVKMAILTNKPVRFSIRLIEGLQLGRHFFKIYGGNSFHEKKPNPIGIETLLQETGADRDRTVMIGDSAVDVLTARNARVRACGVSWGFQPETFQQASPDFLIDDMRTLAEMILDEKRASE
jgi:phosphoglycolate phosphatase